MRARIYAREAALQPRSPTTFAQTPTSQRKNKRNNIISRTDPVKLTFTNPYIYRHAPREQKITLQLASKSDFRTSSRGRTGTGFPIGV